MINKKSFLIAIESLPEEFHLEDLIDKLFIYAKVEKGNKDYDEGRVTSHEDMKILMDSWQK